MTRDEGDVLVAHEYFPQKGGGEYVATKMLETFPGSDLATNYWYPSKWRDTIVEERLTQTTIPYYFAVFVSNIPLKLATTPLARLRLPSYSEMIDTSGYDTVVTSGAWTKAVVTHPGQRHVAYIHTPVRFVWDLYNEKMQERGFLRKRIFNWVSRRIRQWEYVTAQRPDVLVANSENTRARIQKYYDRDAEVIYPPVETEQYRVHAEEIDNPSRNYFFTISRLWKEKHVSEICEAFQNDLPDETLYVAGTGPQSGEMEKYAERNENIQYLGYVSEERKRELYINAKAFVFNAVDEDFGLTPIEANAAGTPVVTVEEGGVLESQSEETAVFFDDYNPESVTDGVERFLAREEEFDRDTLMQNAERFSVQRFKQELKEVVENA